MRSIAILPLVYSSLIVLGRVSSHLPNFAPATAASLMSGSKLSLPVSLITVLGGIFISDYFLGFYDIRVMAAVYVSYLLIVLLGRLIRPKKLTTLFLTALSASLIFFLLTNLAVWAFSPMYTKDATGLLQCFIAALPFFRNSLLADLSYGYLLYRISDWSFYTQAVKKLSNTPAVGL